VEDDERDSTVEERFSPALDATNDEGSSAKGLATTVGAVWDCSDNALLDSAANPIITGDGALFEQLPPRNSTVSSIETASGKLRAEGPGILFAKMRLPGAVGCDDTTMVIRTQALYAPGLQSESLLAVSALTRCLGCSFKVEGKGTATIASLKVADPRGKMHTGYFPEKGGVYPISLEPLSESEMEKLKKENSVLRKDVVGILPTFVKVENVSEVDGVSAETDSRRATGLTGRSRGDQDCVEGEKSSRLKIEYPAQPTACVCQGHENRAKGATPDEPATLDPEAPPRAVKPKKGDDKISARRARRVAKRIHDKLGHIGHQRLDESLKQIGPEIVAELGSVSLRDVNVVMKALRKYHCAACTMARPNKKKANK